MRETIHDRAIGRWRAILPALGLGAHHLTGKHGPCPVCGGKDRFRFDDKDGRGTFYCSKCGPGSGVDLVMRLSGASFIEAVRLIEPLLPDAQVHVPKAAERQPIDGRSIWSRGLPIRRGDAVSKYLGNRGIDLDEYPSQLRMMERALYVFEDGRKEAFPAMIANFVAPDMTATTVHFTFLDRDGRKADVPKVRKFYPGKIPTGGAVRLANSAETMGIAEGIETALSAAQMFEIPVWATLTAGALVKWQPPATTKNIIIFGDHDASFTGQHVAYGLAYRLNTEGYRVEVRLPDASECDWNDVLAAERLDSARGGFECRA